MRAGRAGKQGLFELIERHPRFSKTVRKIQLDDPLQWLDGARCARFRAQTGAPPTSAAEKIFDNPKNAQLPARRTTWKAA
jgi:hypothetical protein